MKKLKPVLLQVSCYTNIVEKLVEEKKSSSLKKIIGETSNTLKASIPPSRINNYDRDNKLDLFNMKLLNKKEKENTMINPLNISNPIGFFNKQKYKLDKNYISKKIIFIRKFRQKSSNKK